MDKKDAIESLKRLLAAYEANRLATSQILARGLVELVKGLPDESEGTVGKPDMGKEWWVIAEHDELPELQEDFLYTYVDEYSGHHTRKGGGFKARFGVLIDMYDDRVLKIKEAGVRDG